MFSYRRMKKKYTSGRKVSFMLQQERDFIRIDKEELFLYCFIVQNSSKTKNPLEEFFLY